MWVLYLEYLDITNHLQQCTQMTHGYDYFDDRYLRPLSYATLARFSNTGSHIIWHLFVILVRLNWNWWDKSYVPTAQADDTTNERPLIMRSNWSYGALLAVVNSQAVNRHRRVTTDSQGPVSLSHCSKTERLAQTPLSCGLELSVIFCTNRHSLPSEQEAELRGSERLQKNYCLVLMVERSGGNYISSVTTS